MLFNYFNIAKNAMKFDVSGERYLKVFKIIVYGRKLLTIKFFEKYTSEGDYLLNSELHQQSVYTPLYSLAAKIS